MLRKSILFIMVWLGSPAAGLIAAETIAEPNAAYWVGGFWFAVYPLFVLFNWSRFSEQRRTFHLLSAENKKRYTDAEAARTNGFIGIYVAPILIYALMQLIPQ